MTIREVIQFGVEKLKDTHSTPQLDIELLLSYSLKESKEYLFRHPEKKLPKKSLDEFKKLLEKRMKGVPISHLTHLQEFFGIPLYVNKDVLIPRPETEEVVEDAISTWKEKTDIGLFLDVGSGSGCIAIAIASTVPNINVIALEKSEKAIKVANKNIKKLKLDKNIQVIKSDILSRLPKKYFSTPKIIVANLPYIGTNTNNFVSDEVKKHEPKEALFGGEDGLDCYRKLMKQIVDKKVSFEVMFFEIGFSQTDAIEREIKHYLPKSKTKILKDMAGFPRTVKILP
jgi:release factor glutamine methyltransferase